MNLDRVRAKYNASNAKGEGSSNKYYKQADNSMVRVRILPPANSEEDLFYEETQLHSIKSGGRFHYLRCRKASDNETCPICEAHYGLWKRINDRKERGLDVDHLMKAAKATWAKPRFFVNVLNRETNDVQVMSCSNQLFDRIMYGIFGDPEDEEIQRPLGDVTDLKEGYDFKVRKYAEGNKDICTFETSLFAPEPSELGTAKEIEAIMGQLHDLKQEIGSSDYNTMSEIAKIYSATPDPEEGTTPGTDPQPSAKDFADRLKNLNS